MELGLGMALLSLGLGRPVVCRMVRPVVLASARTLSSSLGASRSGASGTSGRPSGPDPPPTEFFGTGKRAQERDCLSPHTERRHVLPAGQRGNVLFPAEPFYIHHDKAAIAQHAFHLHAVAQQPVVQQGKQFHAVFPQQLVPSVGQFAQQGRGRLLAFPWRRRRTWRTPLRVADRSSRIL